MDAGTNMDDVDLLLARALWTDATEADRAALDHWIGADPERAALVERLRAAQGVLPAGARPRRVEAGWARMQGRLDAPSLASRSNRPVTRPRTRAIPALAAASVAVVLAVAGWMWTHRASVSAEPPQEYVTGNGERTTIRLADGTAVILNVASRLRVPRDFGSRTRDVWLDGEAQFTVTHAEHVPFSVRTTGTVVRDLATTFVVRAYAGTNATQVSVRDGRVAVHATVSAPTTAVVVDAQHRATIATDGTTRVARANVDDDFAWTRGTLVLRNASVGDAFAILSRWYDLDFRVADSVLLTRTISTTLPATLTQDHLATLAAVLDARVERTGRVVTFSTLP